MKQLLTLTCCMAMTMCLADLATAQGPIRRAVRGAGEATADAARATGRGIRAGVDAATPAVPAQARSGDTDRNASWRRVQHNGDWWYYTPENNWMVYRDNDWTAYSAETYAPNAQYADSGHAVGSQQTVFIDSGGRAVICQNGRIVFVDGTELRSISRTQVNAQGYLIEQGGAQAIDASAAGHVDVHQDAGATTQTAPGAAAGSAGVQGQVDPSNGAVVSGGVNASSPSGGASVQGGASVPGGASADVSGSAGTSTETTSGGAAADAGAAISSDTNGSR